MTDVDTHDDPPPARRRTYRAAQGVLNRSYQFSWLFPSLLAAAIVISAFIVLSVLDLGQAQVGDALAARTTWAIAAMLTLVFFVFTVVACGTVMFKCGKVEDAVVAFAGTTLFGVAMVVLSLAWGPFYFGPVTMKVHLDDSAFCLDGMRTLHASFYGFAAWAAVLVVATSSVIIRNEVRYPEDLSRQLRGSKILMYTAAALLVSGVAEVSALHHWPISDRCQGAALQMADIENIKKTAVAISTTVGTFFSLILATAYLPLGIVLRQRAYRVVTPWERTETWLAVHGFALQPTQQLAKVFLVLSPLLAGGPVSQLISFLSGYDG